MKTTGMRQRLAPRYAKLSVTFMTSCQGHSYPGRPGQSCRSAGNGSLRSSSPGQRAIWPGGSTLRSEGVRGSFPDKPAALCMSDGIIACNGRRLLPNQWCSRLLCRVAGFSFPTTDMSIVEAFCQILSGHLRLGIFTWYLPCKSPYLPTSIRTSLLSRLC